MESAQLISLENRFYRIFSHTKGFSRFGTRSAGSTLHDPQQWVWKCCVGHSTSTGRGRSTNNYHWHNRNWNHSCHNCDDHAVIVSHCKILKLSSDLMLPLDWIWVDHWIECLGWICDSFIPRSRNSFPTITWSAQNFLNFSRFRSQRCVLREGPVLCSMQAIRSMHTRRQKPTVDQLTWKIGPIM